MIDAERRMARFLVAANILVDAYGDMAVRGRFAEPSLAAAALADIKNLVDCLGNAGLDEISFTGADVNALTRMERNFHEHGCTCPFCFCRNESDYTEGHDWHIDKEGVQRCAACTLAHARWAGRGCPQDPEALKGSVHW